jgi:hypothetical protein
MCGSTDLEILHSATYFVWCHKCFAKGSPNSSREEAVSSWNTRPIEDALLEACEATMTHLEDYPPEFYEKGRDDGRDYCIKIARAAIAKARGEA